MYPSGRTGQKPTPVLLSECLFHCPRSLPCLLYTSPFCQLCCLRQIMRYHVSDITFLEQKCNISFLHRPLLSPVSMLTLRISILISNILSSFSCRLSFCIELFVSFIPVKTGTCMFALNPIIPSYLIQKSFHPIHPTVLIPALFVTVQSQAKFHKTGRKCLHF